MRVAEFSTTFPGGTESKGESINGITALMKLCGEPGLGFFLHIELTGSKQARSPDNSMDPALWSGLSQGSNASILFNLEAFC